MINRNARAVIIMGAMFASFVVGIYPRKERLESCERVHKTPPISVGTESGERRLVHEYLELSGDDKYDVHRVIFETGDNRRIDGIDFYREGITRELVESGPLIGHERVFLRY